MASQHPASCTNQTVTWDPSLVPDEGGRTQQPVLTCPVEVALAAIAGRWTTLVLRELMGGPRRFSELQDALPTLSAKVLASRLRALTGRGLAERHAGGFPRQISYRLTPQGQQLRPLLIELYSTGNALLDG